MLSLLRETEIERNIGKGKINTLTNENKGKNPTTTTATTTTIKIEQVVSVIKIGNWF